MHLSRNPCFPTGTVYDTIVVKTDDEIDVTSLKVETTIPGELISILILALSTFTSNPVFPPTLVVVTVLTPSEIATLSPSAASNSTLTSPLI